MGTSKTAIFSTEVNERALLFKALGHPARLAIMEHLLKVNSCICGAIVDEIKLAQPTISQHLKELKAAGLIKGSIEGTSVCYCVNENAIALIRDYFTGFSEQLAAKSSCC